MLSHLRSNAVAYLALFVALGGTSYAAVQLPANSVKAKQIAKNAVATAEVKDGSLTVKDFQGGLPAGPTGPQGPKGLDGSAKARGQLNPAFCADSGPFPQACTGIAVTQTTPGFTVRRVGFGQYCVSAPGLSPTADFAFVTVANAGTAVPQTLAAVFFIGGGCTGAPNDFLVETRRTATGPVAASGGGSTTVPDDADVMANDVGFQMIIV